MADTTVATAARLNGVPLVNIAENLRVAFDNGRRLSAILQEIVTLRRAAGKLAPSEYFYYRLWDPHLSLEEKRCFVGKQAQHRMHVACNDRHWYQTAADKILFHTIMAGAALPVPQVTAITQAGRRLRGALTLDEPDAIAAFLRDPANFPLFAKPAAGKYSLNVISADAYDPASDELILFGGARQPVPTTAQTMAEGAGYVIQPRLRPAAEIEAKFGPASGPCGFWSSSARMALTSIAPWRRSRRATTRPTITGGPATCSARSISHPGGSSAPSVAPPPK